MSDKSKIGWTDATWNPITGCTVVSPGCTNCYAMKLAGGRLKHHPSRKGLTNPSKKGPVWNGEIRFNQQWLDQPLHWKKTRMIFVCAHGDLFHEDVPFHWISEIFSIMSHCPQHIFQILTKRPDRMREFIEWQGVTPTAIANDGDGESLIEPWPLFNVWLGVSAEDQVRANERIQTLLDIPATIRFVSLEPQLEEIDLYRGGWSLLKRKDIKGKITGELDWVIQGCESGPNARRFDISWARLMRDQCAAEGVAFFLKQIQVDGSVVHDPYLDGVQHLGFPSHLGIF